MYENILRQLIKDAPALRRAINGVVMINIYADVSYDIRLGHYSKYYINETKVCISGLTYTGIVAVFGYFLEFDL